VLTLKMLNEWSKSLISSNSFKALRDLVRAFESACHLDDVEDMRGKEKAKKTAKRARGGDAGSRLKFRIVSGQVFERLMRMCVTKMHVYVGVYLQLKQHVDTSAPRKINPQLSTRWKRASLVVKAYVKSMTAFVETLTDPSMVHLLLRHTERMMPYVRPFPKVARKLLKVALKVFGSQEENRVQAFSRRAPASTGDAVSLHRGLLQGALPHLRPLLQVFQRHRCGWPSLHGTVRCRALRYRPQRGI
jgi:hypothetical protein